jgi:hypothetical protein
MTKKLPLLGLLIAALFILTAFISKDEIGSSLFNDNFDHYFSTIQLRRAYASWENGARLEIALNTSSFDTGHQSMQIDVQGQSTVGGLANGSIYHSLSLQERNWTGASGFSFWIFNPSTTPLSLTFNFKEAYNEYWSVSHGSPVLLQSTSNETIQSQSRYGNINIPAGFSGWVILPISSFSVPDWNTARGDQKLQLSSIESFAIGITLHDNSSCTFFLDSFKVIPEDESIIWINGADELTIPPDGELSEVYTLQNSSPVEHRSFMWMVESHNNPDVYLEENGTLLIQAGYSAEVISVKAVFFSPSGTHSVSKAVKLIGGIDPIESSAASIQETTPVYQQPVESDYARLSKAFEHWAMEDRPMFVLASVVLVVLFISLLSAIQNRLK